MKHLQHPPTMHNILLITEKWRTLAYFVLLNQGQGTYGSPDVVSLTTVNVGFGSWELESTTGKPQVSPSLN